ncbi:MAG: hypothetical protein JWP02_1456 [Acidimicrobiales bacterium]|nr:hypothetical protein [Acidimicrobiales bacterium]
MNAGPTGPGVSPDDPVLSAMGALVRALRRFSSESEELLGALDRAAGRREAGASYREIAEGGGVIVGFGSGALRDLLDAVSEFRRAEARALYEEGMTMAQLGRTLGITRQRVAVLLDDKKRDRP